MDRKKIKNVVISMICLSLLGLVCLNRVYDCYIKAAQDILNSSQLEQLKSYLNIKRNMQFTITVGGEHEEKKSE
jgi:hypothetical protein